MTAIISNLPKAKFMYVSLHSYIYTEWIYFWRDEPSRSHLSWTWLIEGKKEGEFKWKWGMFESVMDAERKDSEEGDDNWLWLSTTSQKIQVFSATAERGD